MNYPEFHHGGAEGAEGGKVYENPSSLCVLGVSAVNTLPHPLKKRLGISRGGAEGAEGGKVYENPSSLGVLSVSAVNTLPPLVAATGEIKKG